MYVSIRRYDLAEGADVKELAGHVTDVFIPTLSDAPGFKAYYVIDAGDGVVAAISVFEHRAGAEESNRLAADYVRANIASLVVGPPEVTQGNVVVRVE
jgi:hypothetical protein